MKPDIYRAVKNLLTCHAGQPTRDDWRSSVDFLPSVLSNRQSSGGSQSEFRSTFQLSSAEMGAFGELRSTAVVEDSEAFPHEEGQPVASEEKVEDNDEESAMFEFRLPASLQRLQESTSPSTTSVDEGYSQLPLNHLGVSQSSLDHLSIASSTETTEMVFGPDRSATVADDGRTLLQKAFDEKGADALKEFKDDEDDDNILPPVAKLGEASTPSQDDWEEGP